MKELESCKNPRVLAEYIASSLPLFSMDLENLKQLVISHVERKKLATHLADVRQKIGNYEKRCLLQLVVMYPF